MVGGRTEGAVKSCTLRRGATPCEPKWGQAKAQFDWPLSLTRLGPFGGNRFALEKLTNLPQHAVRRTLGSGRFGPTRKRRPPDRRVRFWGATAAHTRAGRWSAGAESDVVGTAPRSGIEVQCPLEWIVADESHEGEPSDANYHDRFR